MPQLFDLNQTDPDKNAERADCLKVLYFCYKISKNFNGFLNLKDVYAGRGLQYSCVI